MKPGDIIEIVGGGRGVLWVVVEVRAAYFANHVRLIGAARVVDDVYSGLKTEDQCVAVPDAQRRLTAMHDGLAATIARVQALMEPAPPDYKDRLRLLVERNSPATLAQMFLGSCEAYRRLLDDYADAKRGSTGSPPDAAPLG